MASVPIKLNNTARTAARELWEALRPLSGCSDEMAPPYQTLAGFALDLALKRDVTDEELAARFRRYVDFHSCSIDRF